MEKNVPVETYLVLDTKGIESVKEESEKIAKENEYEEGELLFEDAELKSDEIYFNEELKSLIVSGEIYKDGKKIGYINLTIPLGNDTILEIINSRIEKLEKVKKVMEAIKD